MWFFFLQYHVLGIVNRLILLMLRLKHTTAKGPRADNGNK